MVMILKIKKGDQFLLEVDKTREHNCLFLCHCGGMLTSLNSPFYYNIVNLRHVQRQTPLYVLEVLNNLS